MRLLDNITSSADWGFIDPEGRLFLSSRLRTDLDPFSLWHINGSTVAVFYQNLREPSEPVDPNNIADAVVAVTDADWEAARVTQRVVLNNDVDPQLIAVASVLACVDAGRLDTHEDIEVTSGEKRTIIYTAPVTDPPGWSAICRD